MNNLLEDLMYAAGITAQGGWDEMDDYQQQAVEKLVELVVKECANICLNNAATYQYSFTPARAQLAESTSKYCALLIKEHFGVE